MNNKISVWKGGLTGAFSKLTPPRTWLYHSKKDAISEGIARAGCIGDKLTNYGSYFGRESG
jgi:hypothetical protein